MFHKDMLFISTHNGFIIFLLRLFFSVFSLQQHLGKGADISHIPATPTHAQPPALSTTPLRVGDICYN